jgi:hypothetical protein
MKSTKDHTVRTNATSFTFARMATTVFCSSNFGFVSLIIVMRCRIRLKRLQLDTAIRVARLCVTYDEISCDQGLETLLDMGKRRLYQFFYCGTRVLAGG